MNPFQLELQDSLLVTPNSVTQISSYLTNSEPLTNIQYILSTLWFGIPLDSYYATGQNLWRRKATVHRTGDKLISLLTDSLLTVEIQLCAIRTQLPVIILNQFTVVIVWYLVCFFSCRDRGANGIERCEHESKSANTSHLCSVAASDAAKYEKGSRLDHLGLWIIVLFS
jgi:hypothetical protein